MQLLSFELFSFQSDREQVSDERHDAHTVTWRIYVNYFSSGAGISKMFVLAVVFIIAQGALIASDWWLSRWYIYKVHKK